MKLTTKSEYSLLLLLTLARSANSRKGVEPRPVHLEELCASSDVPYKYAEQLFSVLKKVGIVKARRGAAGGYLLGRSANKITLAEIIRMMDGALAPTEAVSHYFFSETPVSKEKKLVAIFRDIRDYISNHLEKVTLEDLL